MEYTHQELIEIPIKRYFESFKKPKNEFLEAAARQLGLTERQVRNKIKTDDFSPSEKEAIFKILKGMNQLIDFNAL